MIVYNNKAFFDDDDDNNKALILTELDRIYKTVRDPKTDDHDH